MGEKMIILDYLPNGSRNDRRPPHLRPPVVQGIAEKQLVLLEAEIKPSFEAELGQKIETDSEEIEKVRGRISSDDLTTTARNELEDQLKVIIEENEKDFVDFFNKAPPISTRIHSLELIPGIGKKHMWEILDERKIKKFETFSDLQDRVKLLPDPKKAILKRILEELEEKDRHFIFVRAPPQKRDRYGGRRGRRR